LRNFVFHRGGGEHDRDSNRPRSERLGLELALDRQHQEEGRFGSIPLFSERLYRCGICC